MAKKLTLGFSPCPNDTFIFDALVNKKIDTDNFSFEVVLEDVQTLNEWALSGKLDISKISYGVLPLLLQKYSLLEAGGALGKGVGPLLITHGKNGITREQINDATIAIPGEHTTAHMLFSLAFPYAKNKKFMIFSEIENSVMNHSVDAGVIIHENRFTYQQKGLHKLMDLGQYWEQQTHAPIPLGGIVMRKDHPASLHRKINDLIGKSLAWAWSSYPVITSYVKEHSQEMNEQVMRQHIDLYVNNYSSNLGEDGKMAVRQFLNIYSTNKHIDVNNEAIFSY